MSDAELLHEYAHARNEAAFTELVKRHIDWVYSTALRRVRDAHLAEDVAQMTFIVLAQKAGTLGNQKVIAAWLFQVVARLSAQALRTKARLMRSQMSAAEVMGRSASEPALRQEWEQVVGLLDAAVERLGRADREAVLLRFYQRKSLAEVGAALGTTEDAARKRVGRAIEKLRGALVARGVQMPSVVLAGLLWAELTQPAPGAVVVAVSTGWGVSVGAWPAVFSNGVTNMMAWSKLKIAVAGLGILTVLGGSALALLQLPAGQAPASQPAQLVADPAANVAALIAGIRAHDAQISSIEVDFRVDTGMVDGIPNVRLLHTWLVSGTKQAMTTQREGVAVVSREAFDGKETRSYIAAPEMRGFPNGFIEPGDRRTTFGQQYLFTARNIWTHHLIELLESGRARVSPNPVMRDGVPCWEVAGQVMTQVPEARVGRFTLSLDPARGFMPLYFEQSSVNEAGEAPTRVIEDVYLPTRYIRDKYVLKEVAKGIWFPASLEQRAFRPDEKGELVAQLDGRSEVTKVLVNQPIADERFVIEFPNGTTLMTRDAPGGRMRSSVVGTTQPARRGRRGQ